MDEGQDTGPKEFEICLEFYIVNHAFSHLSFQEYFAAWYLAEQVTAPPRRTDANAATVTMDDLRNYADDATWRETLALLFELLAERPGWSDELAVTLFGDNCSALVFDHKNDHRHAAALLCTVAADSHAGLSSDMRGAAFKACWRWELAQVQLRWVWSGLGIPAALLGADASDLPEVWRAFDGVASEQEPEVLSLDGCTSFSDLTKVSNLTNLGVLVLSDTAVADLEPIRSLEMLKQLWLDGTYVMDLEPLADLVTLTDLDLSFTNVENLRPLHGLKHLTDLGLVGTGVPDEEVAALQEALPDVGIHR